MINIFRRSWTYAKLTDSEKAQFDRLWDMVPITDAIKGIEKHRKEVQNAVYLAFLMGCGYKNTDCKWREANPESIPF